MLTLYPHRPAEVGVPGENPHLDERGLILTDFVDRVGDPVAIVAGDGSSHRADVLMADALRSLLHALTGGKAASEPVGVTHPAHWRSGAVDALRGALAARGDFAGPNPVLLVSDAIASLTALQDDPGVPTRGIIALCDLGGTGASITLADAANGFQPIGPTVRHTDLSGDLIDQALLHRVVADLATAGSVDLSSTSAIGSLSRLRAQCRGAKERLSTVAVTSLAVELPGHRTEVRITRTELDDAIREPLDGFIAVLQDTLQRNGISPVDLVAVASVGGGARIPVLTTSLSEHLRVPVITSAQPELAAAIGGAMKAVRGLVPDGATAMSSAAAVAAIPPPAVDPGAPGSSTFRALAWSDADDIPEPVAADPADVQDVPSYEPYDPRPQLAFADHVSDAEEVAAVAPWYRRPIAILAAGVVVAILAVGGAALYVLRNDESPLTTTPSTPASTTTTAPPPSDVPQPSLEPPPEAPAPGPRTVIEQAPPPVTVTEAPPPAPPTTTPPPPPPTTTEPPVTVTETAPSSTAPSTTTQQPIIPTLPYQTIPGLPFIPAPIQPAQP